jgi:hypothetical protein
MAGRVAYTGGIVRNGLVLHLDAAKRDSYPKTGTVWSDLSGRGNTGTLNNMGGTGYTSSNGGTLVFDGVDDYVSGNSAIPNNSSFTVNFWMYYLSDGLTRGIISTWDTSWNGFAISVVSSGNLRSWTNDGASGGMNWVSYSSISNVWSNVTLVYNYTNKTQYGYINGILRNSETFGTTITHSTLQLGRGGQSGSLQLTNYPYSSSRISNLQIYNRALSVAEITQNYNALKGRYI